jgi:hypothetical protein
MRDFLKGEGGTTFLAGMVGAPAPLYSDLRYDPLWNFGLCHLASLVLHAFLKE